MARKDASDRTAENRGGEILGIVLVSLSVLLLIAMFSFDKGDVSFNKTEVNIPRHNLIGVFGAWTAHGFFFLFGAAAYLLPPLLLTLGMAQFLPPLGYLRRRWGWAAMMFLCCMVWLALYPGLFDELGRRLNAPSAGGVVGQFLNDYVFSHFGTLGATILIGTLYLISLVCFTNFKVFDWIEAAWDNFRARRAAATAEELELERRARELEREARKLEQQVAKGAKPAKGEGRPEDRTETKPDSKVVGKEAAAVGPLLGPDMKPVPEPTVRDLSVANSWPEPGTAKAAKSGAAAPVAATKPGKDPSAILITAQELAAATTDQVLGRGAAKPAERTADKVTEKPAGKIAEKAAEKPVDKPAPDQPPVPVEPAVKHDVGVPPMPPALPAPAPVALLPRPKPTPKKPKPITVASTPMIGNYQVPPMDFLQRPDLTLRPTESKEELMANARLMQQTLAQFDIDVALGDITKGPTITRYELHPAPGVKLEKISGLTNNIAAALKAERIHILAPVPGKSSVGIEVPNLVKTKVIMRDLLESDEWKNSKARIPLALGKDVYGHPIIADLAEMPHCLIAGSTGSGKSVCINAIIASLLYKFSPDQLRFVMIDPKVVELQQYNSLPHLVVPVVNDPKKVILALRWVVNEMEKRYQIFARVGVRNIKSFNDRPKDKPLPQAELELPLVAKKEKVEAGADGFAVEVDEQIVVPRDDDIIIPEKLSYIVVIIDELADLMLVAPADVEMAIARITQMARAAGIHCIVATQRPSVDVITGVIKANIPARIAFQVAARVDSRTILDAMGADKLLGKGDMLYLPPGSARLIRAQGVLITDQEIQDVVDFIAKQGKPSYEVEIHQQLQKPVSSLDGEEGGLEEDEGLIDQCIEVIRSEQKASVSLLQRRLRLGYGRAARIMDELEQRGIVGPANGAEPRDILIDLDGGGADGADQRHGV